MDKILIVDDIEQNVELISKYLINAGYDVISANNGQVALKKIKMFKPDLVILDLIMPGMSGYDVLKVLRNDEETISLLVLVVTALDTKESRTRAFELGADDYLIKSFDKVLLLSKVKALLRMKVLSDQLKNQYAALEERDKLIDYQLKMARNVQRSLIQEVNFDMNNANFVSKYIPALYVGGDMYDIANVREGVVSVIMGDVSGHGISAALLTAMLKMMFRNVINSNCLEPDKLLYHMNTEFCNVFDNGTDIYACVFYAYIDTKNKTIIYANAGQALPIFVDAAKSTAFELESSGVPLGLMENTKYEYKSLKFNKGDMLFFHTDGLVDSFYKDTPDLFLTRLKEVLVDASNSQTHSSDILKQIIDEFYDMSDSAKYTNDDVSMILCRM